MKEETKSMLCSLQTYVHHDKTNANPKINPRIVNQHLRETVFCMKTYHRHFARGPPNTSTSKFNSATNTILLSKNHIILIEQHILCYNYYMSEEFRQRNYFYEHLITHLVYSSVSCSIKHLSSFHQGNGTSRRLLIYHSPNHMWSCHSNILVIRVIYTCLKNACTVRVTGRKLLLSGVPILPPSSLVPSAPNCAGNPALEMKLSFFFNAELEGALSSTVDRLSAPPLVLEDID